MSLFKCSECGVVENTALSLYWTRYRRSRFDNRALCSQCNPEIGRWHNVFERVDADAAGYEPIPESPQFIQRPK